MKLRAISVGLLAAAALAGACCGQGVPVRPRVSMGVPSYDNGRFFRDLFEHPEQWAATRSNVDAIIYADHWLDKHFTDDELRAWLPMLERWGLKLELEVGAIKPWGTTAAATFAAQRPTWERARKAGAKIHTLALDEPLSCCREYIHRPDEHALRETAAFIAMVRTNYPQFAICEMETYPSISLDDHRRWIVALEQRLADLGVRGLDEYRLDVNWAVFTAYNQGSWREVKQLEDFCRGRRLPFGLFYWASDQPPMQRKGLADDSTWYVSIMRQGYDYALVDGAPDHYVVQSWLEAPSACVPEAAPWTFTRSVLDFTRKFAARAPR